MLDYSQLFHNRLLLINGPARSGTSLLGKLLGSCQYTFYLYEPVLLQFPSPSQLPAPTLMTLFEDYFLPLMTGRSENHNRSDETHYRDYFRERHLWGARRSTVLSYITDVSPTFIIKLTDITHLRHTKINYLTNSPVCDFINRDGCEVVSSSISRGWYTDSWLEAAITDFWTTTVPLSDQWMWHPNAASPATRAACLWRNFTTQFPVPDITYESLTNDPDSVIDSLLTKHNLTPTPLTYQHIDAIKRHNPTPHNSQLTISQITPDSERGKFISALSLYHAHG